MTFSKKTLAFGLLGLVLPMLLIYTTNLTELPQVIDKLCGSGIGGFSLQETYIYSPPAAIVLVAIYIYICHKQGWRFAHWFVMPIARYFTKKSELLIRSF